MSSFISKDKIKLPLTNVFEKEIPKELKLNPAETINELLFDDKPDIRFSLDDPSYKNITIEEAAGILSYFMKTMQEAGYPWGLSKEVKEGDQTKTVKISEIEALRSLEKEEPVILQPKRKLSLTLSTTSLKALSVISPLGTLDQKKMGELGTTLSAEPINKTVKFGKAVTVHSFGELKLLMQLNNPKLEVKGTEQEEKIAHYLSTFNSKSADSKVVWMMFKPSEGKMGKVRSLLKNMTKRGLLLAGIGALMGGLVAGPLGIALGIKLSGLLAGIELGAAAGGGYGLFVGAKTAIKAGDPINAFEALDMTIGEKPFVIQKSEKRGFNLPIIGSINWYEPDGEPIKVENAKDLELIAKVYEEKKPPEKPPEKPLEKPPEKLPE